MSAADPAPLSEDEQRVFEAVNDIETNAGAPGSLVDIARRAGMAPERARIAMSRLTAELGLVSEMPGSPTDDPVYTATGRAGEAAGAGISLDELPRELARCLTDTPFPAPTGDVVRAVSRHGAPRPLRLAVEQLPPDRTFVNLEELYRAVEQELG